VSEQVFVPAQNVGVEAGHAQLPPTHFWAAGQTAPPCLAQPPQFLSSVCVFVQRPAHITVALPHEQLPFWQAAPAPRVLAHLVSTAGSSSTIPSQSLSLPSQISAEYLHWQMLLACPASGPHDQPATQSVAPEHVAVQTLVPLPIGRQIPLGQSAFLAHIWPMAPLATWVHTLLLQIRFDEEQVPPGQHISPKAPQAGPASA